MASWELVVRHDDPGVNAARNATCRELLARGEMRVTQPARLVLGGLATLGSPLPVVCLGCNAELQIVSRAMKGNRPPHID